MNLTWFTKPFCRFLIHRYMGQYLKTEITTDQLELKLQDGIASVQNVSLNVEYIDELIANLGIVRVLQGYVEEISVNVPWSRIMHESTSIDAFNAQDLVSSMVGSIASNLELARSFMDNEETMEAASDPQSGVDHLAELFDKVIGRIKIIFENTTMRLETEAEFATGLELQIDMMEFVDEKLDSCEQKQDSSITSQPTSLTIVAELDKLLYVRGVRIYTDIWSNLRESMSMTSSQELGPTLLNESYRSTNEQMLSSSFQSCYSHFSDKKCPPTNSSLNHSGDLSNAALIPTNPILFAEFDERITLRIRVYNMASTMRGDFNKKVEIDIDVSGNAFIFATPTQLLLIRELLLMITPSATQKSGSDRTSHAAGGRPMRSDDYTHVWNVAAASTFAKDPYLYDRDIGDTATLHSNAINARTFSNNNTNFYELQQSAPSRRSASIAFSNKHFTTISLQDDGDDNQHQRHESEAAMFYGAAGLANADNESLTERGTQHGSNLTLADNRPDLIRFIINIPNLIVIITHDDPLAADQVFTNITNSSDFMSPVNLAAIHAQIAKLSKMSEHFFKSSEDFSLLSWKVWDSSKSFISLKQNFETLSKLYGEDHLKILARQAHFEFDNECDGQRSIFELKCELRECDVSEFLSADSVYQPDATTKKPIFSEIVNFCNLKDFQKFIPNNPNSPPHVKFYFKSFNEREHHRRAEFFLQPCRSHLDISIIDRLHHLIVTRPFYTQIRSSQANFLGATNSISNRDDLFAGLTIGLQENFMQLADTFQMPEVNKTYDVIFNCTQWLLDLRVPRADYTAEAAAFTVKNLHEEFLRLNIVSACLDVSRFHVDDLTQHGQINLKCLSITGEFVGDPEFLATTEQKFFHATAISNSSCGDKNVVSICVKYDFRNHQLQLRPTQLDPEFGPLMSSLNSNSNSDSKQNSKYNSFCPRTNSDKYDEGPFGQAREYYCSKRLISAGKRRELEEFASECLRASAMTVELSMPQLNVYLPSHMFLEVLYNRFANDFALWSLRAPVFNNSQNRQHSGNLQVLTPLQPIADYPLRDNDHLFVELGSDHNKSSESSNISEDMSTPAVNSHLFSLQIKAKSCRLMARNQIKQEVKREDNRIESEEFGAQVGTELKNGHFFIVHGYKKMKELDYLFVSAARTFLFHRNLFQGVKPMVIVVDEPNFANYGHSDTHIRPIRLKANISDTEDNLSIALKILHNPAENQRNITLAISLRDTLVYYRPVVNPQHYWLQQFSKFFDLIDYDVPGYEWPQLVTDIHVQLENLTVSYDHSIVVPESQFNLRVLLGLCHFSVSISQLTEKLYLNCLLQDSKLYLSKRPSRQVRFINKNWKLSSDFIDVKVGEIGLLFANLDYTLSNTLSPSVWDLRMRSDGITLWLCSDTVIELNKLLIEFITSDVGKTMMQNSTKTSVASDLVGVFDSDAMSHIPESLSSGTNFEETIGSQVNLRTQPSVSSLTSAVTTVSQSNHLTEMEHEALKEMILSAMQDSSDNLAILKIPDCNQSHMSSQPGISESDNSERFEDDFVHLDEFLGSGITNARGEPKVRILEDDEFSVISNYLPVVEDNPESDVIRLPDSYPQPIGKLAVEDFSLFIYFYGGSDFSLNDNRPEQKTYSLWEHKKDSPDCCRETSEGGPNRDHTVCVHVRVTKVSFVRKIFDENAPILSACMLSIGDAEILDYLLISQIKKFFYKYEHSSMPPRLNAPLLSVRIVENAYKEGKLKISLLPLRLNIDQDTLEFLTDFATALAACGAAIPKNLSDDTASTEVHVMEINNDNRSQQIATLASTNSSEPSFTWSRGAAADYDSDMEEAEETSEIRNFKSNTSFDPFDESDINFADGDDYGHLPLSTVNMPTRSAPTRQSRASIRSTSTTTSASSIKIRRASVQSGVNEEMIIGTSNTFNPSICASNSTQSVSDSTSGQSTMQRRRACVQTNAIFFKEFAFEPACTICFDYVGKRVKTDQGTMIGLLRGMMDTKCTKLTLKEIRNERGILGWNKCAMHALNEWSVDLRLQLPSTLTSYGPITSLVQIGQGVRDLFFIPMMEMRREDGRLIRGLHRGATSFGTSTATAAIDAAQQIVGIFHGTAEIVFDLLTPDLPYRDPRRHNACQYRTVRVPADIREGASMAYDTVSTSFRETARTLHNAVQNDRARVANEPQGYTSVLGGSREVIRHVLPTIARAAVTFAEATNQGLSGLKNQLKPDEHREELQKWRQVAPANVQYPQRFHKTPHSSRN